MGWLLPAAAHAQSSWQWATAQTTSSSGTSYIVAAAPDGAGNTVVAGRFSGTITLGPTTLVSNGNDDLFVAWIDDAGNWLRAVGGGGTGGEFARALAVDAAGNVTVVGNFGGAQATFGSFVLNQMTTGGTLRNEIFVVRLSRTGQWMQAVSAGGNNTDEAYDVAIDSNGDAVVVGYLDSQTAYFGSLPVTGGSSTQPTYYDGFVARLSAAGQWTQAVRFGGASTDYAAAVALDAAGNACVVGHFSSAVASFGPLTVTNSQPNDMSHDLFVARLSRAGQWTQAVAAGSNNYDFANDVALDASGNATVVGTFAGPTARFGSYTVANSTPATGSPSADIFVARLSSAGQWTQAVGAGGAGDSDYASAVALDANGTAFVAGHYYSAVAQFGATSLTNRRAQSPIPPTYSSDLYVAQLSPAGTWGRVDNAGSWRDDQATAVVLEASGKATVAGNINLGTVTFGSLSVTLNRSSGFVARLGPAVTSTRVASGATVALFPNPARETVSLSWPARAEAAWLSLFDATGRLVRQQPVPAGSTGTSLSVAGLPAGLYTVRVGFSSARLMVE